MNSSQAGIAHIYDIPSLSVSIIPFPKARVHISIAHNLVLNLSRNQTKLEMLHLLSLFVLPYLLPTAEAKGAFLYFCFGEGCSGWDLALSCVSILFTMCCFLSVISSCCKGKVKNEEAEFRTETV